MRNILVLSGRKEALAVVREALGGEDAVVHAPGAPAKGDGLLKSVRTGAWDLVFVELEDLGRPLPKGVAEGVAALRRAAPSAELVVMARPADLAMAVEAVKAGAGNYLIHPLDAAEVRYVVQSLARAVIRDSELDYLRDKFWGEDARDVVRTDNSRMRDLFEQVRKVAPTGSTVLLTGETGTGKSLVARLIHSHSERKAAQFIGVHCGAMPDTLVESELFGHEKGAFTGAVRKKLGKFEIAHGGTIFLDEVGTLSASAQIRLLHVLQERRFQRVGGEADIACDARVIAATNEDLEDLARQGAFRRDLYYRLNVFPLHIPPLRERPEDIVRLAERFLRRYAEAMRKDIRGLHAGVVDALRAYHWPGNVRELENVVERGCILEGSAVLRAESLPPEIVHGAPGAAPVTVDTDLPLAAVRRMAVDQVERDYLRGLMRLHKGRIAPAARQAGVSPRQLHNLMRRHGVDKKRYKG